MIVLDATVLVSATFRRDGVPARAVRHGFQSDRVAISEAVLSELLDVLDRPRLARLIDPDLRAELVGQLDSVGALFTPTEPVADCRDAKDDKYLELALAAGARTIVSSDADLLELHPWRGVRVLRPADYLAGAAGAAVRPSGERHPIAAVLIDIEGTTTPIAFVRDTLFPFARARMADFLAAHGADPEVAEALAATRRAAPGAEPLHTLLQWMDQDAKATPLKTLQGLIWRQGYDDGTLQGPLYPDVAPCLRAWAGAGVRLFVYSSGSVAAQRQLFGRSSAGDLTGLFSGWYDTAVGNKREADSYDRIAIAASVPSSAMLFLSDVEAELDAAAAGGLRTCQLVRRADGTLASRRHARAADFRRAARLFGLPTV